MRNETGCCRFEKQGEILFTLCRFTAMNKNSHANWWIRVHNFVRSSTLNCLSIFAFCAVLSSHMRFCNWILNVFCRFADFFLLFAHKVMARMKTIHGIYTSEPVLREHEAARRQNKYVRFIYKRLCGSCVVSDVYEKLDARENQQFHVQL